MADESKIFKVEIITPDRIFYTGEGDMIEFTTASGELGVYKKHIPLTTVLAPGIVKIHKEGEEDVVAAVHSGFAEILPDKVTLLAEIAEWPDEIDKGRAEAAEGAHDDCVMAAAITYYTMPQAEYVQNNEVSEEFEYSQDDLDFINYGG